MSKILMVTMLAAAFILSAAADNSVSRNLVWGYPAYSTAFAEPSNWYLATGEHQSVVVSDEHPDSSPGFADTVRFYSRGGVTSAAADNTVTLSGNGAVSNFIYVVTADSGKLTIDFARYTLDVTGEVHFLTRSYASSSMLCLKDGTLRQFGTWTGKKSQWGEMEESYPGIFLNRQNAQNSGGNVTFDNMTVDARSGRTPEFRWNTLQGHTHHLIFTNGTQFLCNNLIIVPSTTEVFVGGEDTRIAVDDGVYNAGDHSLFSLTMDAASRVAFADGATLCAGQLRVGGSGTLVFDGGRHELLAGNHWGDVGTLVAEGGTVILTNGASVAYARKMENYGVIVRNGATLIVGEGCSLTNARDNCWFRAGSVGGGYSSKFGSTTVVDGGTILASWVDFGCKEALSNHVLRIKGPQSYIAQTKSTEWGSARAMSFNYGAGIEFEFPAEGYHDANGVSRAPIKAAGCFGSTAGTVARPIYIKLNTRAFDRAHPEESLTLMQATAKTDNKSHDTSAFYAKLLENIVWENAYHGELTVSEDGKSLLYTAPPKRGLMLIFR